MNPQPSEGFRDTLKVDGQLQAELYVRPPLKKKLQMKSIVNPRVGLRVDDLGTPKPQTANGTTRKKKKTGNDDDHEEKWLISTLQ